MHYHGFSPGIYEGAFLLNGGGVFSLIFNTFPGTVQRKFTQNKKIKISVRLFCKLGASL
jgi:hypothetical protein